MRSNVDPSKRCGTNRTGRPDGVVTVPVDGAAVDPVLGAVPAAPDPLSLEHDTNTNPTAAPPASLSSWRRGRVLSVWNGGFSGVGVILIAAFLWGAPSHVIKEL